MTAIRIFILMIVATLALSLGCRREPPLEQVEDYEAIFPFGGISKPETSFEDMERMPCNPDAALSTYQYPGVKIEDDPIEYIVTLRCHFTAGEAGNARYRLRYISPSAELVDVLSDAPDNATEQLKPDVTYEKTFRVHSGYPLYLGLQGVAPRGSSISASISARSVDGLVVVPTLSTEQTQNREGPNPIPAPYCEYIILP
ncbi:MAG: hypothetical protein Q4A61_03885 [Porphyromonadaceae bacterium]|nr:hypothetical protein [Porphyromonadaceae bacterium]